jgi:F-type H+-transporting ATPase subunit b
MLLPALLLVITAEGEGMGGPFSLEPGLIIWTWVVFGALLFLLWKYAWPAIVRATEERERAIARQLDEAERLNAEAKGALEEHRKLLAGAKDEAQSLLAEAKNAGEKERQQLLAKARAEQEQILDRAKREIDAERDRAITDLRREAVDLSLAAAAKLVEERFDSAADRKLVQDYLGSVGDSH